METLLVELAESAHVGLIADLAAPSPVPWRRFAFHEGFGCGLKHSSMSYSNRDNAFRSVPGADPACLECVAEMLIQVPLILKVLVYVPTGKAASKSLSRTMLYAILKWGPIETTGQKHTGWDRLTGE